MEKLHVTRKAFSSNLGGNYRKGLMAACATALFWCCSADAAIVTINLTGHVLPYITGNANMGLDQYGFFGGGPNSRINGDAYSATIVYDTGLAPADSSPSTPNYGYYSRDCDPCSVSANGQPFLSMSFTINGHAETVTGADHLETALVSNASSPAQQTISFFTNNHTSPTVTNGTPFDESYADFSFNSIPGSLLTTGKSLPTSVNLNNLQYGPGDKIGDLSILTGVYGNANTINESVYAYLGLDQVTSWSVSSPVPEPSSYAMLLAGLGLIGFIAYRRRNDGSGILMMGQVS